MNDNKEISNQDDRNDDIEYRMIENQVKEMKIKSTTLYILLILSCFLSAKAQKFDNIYTKGNSIHSIFKDSRGILWLGTNDGIMTDEKEI